MIELARLYQEVAELVQQQEPAVEQINERANEVVENVEQANKHIDHAIESARKARKWKWITLLVVSKYLPTPHVWDECLQCQFSSSLSSSVWPWAL